jgi:hypothetical protein
VLVIGFKCRTSIEDFRKLGVGICSPARCWAVEVSSRVGRGDDAIDRFCDTDGKAVICL